MALNSSGPISLAGTTAGQSIEIENGGNGTTQISLNDTAVRNLAGVTTPNSTIIMPTNFYGKSNRVVSNLTIASSTNNYVLGTSKVTGYIAGKTDVTLTINSGVYVGSSTTGGVALTVDSTWTTGDTVTIVNNGYIVGMGGAGGNGGYESPGSSGSAGGKALSVARATTINNGSGTIGGGGGGGGGGGSTLWGSLGRSVAGGGGGGGRSGAVTYSAGGTTYISYGSSNGGNGTNSSAGAGGSGATYNCCAQIWGGNGGNGGTWGASGSNGADGYYSNNPFPTGVSTWSGAAAGGAGACLTGNSFITWTATGTRLGSIS